MRWIAPLINLALPPRCAGCGCVVSADAHLCATCWQTMEFVSGQGCLRCGIPMDQPGMTCGPCLAHPPAFETASAAVIYGGVAREIAVRLKHGRRPAMAVLMANAMARHLPEGPHVLVPVPLHRWRLWRRGFNQSMLICKALSKHSGWPVAGEMLVRRRATPMLGGLGRAARERAVRGAFALSRDAKSQLRGSNVLLIDDVHTSGATANACARVLRRGGAASVRLLTWARVLPDEEGGN